MRFALAGLGSAAARAHLPAIGHLSAAGLATLVGAADPDERRRAEAGVALPHLSLFESAEEMLASVACDVLVVAAEPGAHADLIALGLQRGLHVICEKPLVVTREQYDRVALAHIHSPQQAIIPVHQYRYSPTWVLISRFARAAARLRIPFSLTVDVQRPGVDALAFSSWRADPEVSGGMLADHGVHYLALAWTIDEDLDVLAGLRAWGEAGERSAASCRLGPGTLTIQVGTGTAVRRTCIAFHAAGLGMRWCNDSLQVGMGGRTVFARHVAALADRTHVNALYERFYRDFASNVRRPAWRSHRTAEALVVGRTLVELLERTPGPVPSA